MRRCPTPSLPGLTRQSILLRKKMDARVKPAHDGVRTLRRRDFVTSLLGGAAAAWPRASDVRRVVLLQLVKSLAMDRAKANVNPPTAVPQITGADN